MPTLGFDQFLPEGEPSEIRPGLSPWSRVARLWLLLLVISACMGASSQDEAVVTPAEPAVSTTTIPAPMTTTIRETTTTISETSTTFEESTARPGPSACSSPTETPEGPSATAEVILETDDLTVLAARYPHPDYEGNPWSQWGRGVLTEDGRFLSAIGDHLGRDGNSYFYEFDPESSRLTLISDVLSVVEHREGDWGYGKIHGALVRDECLVYAATYWGSRRGLQYGGTYRGDHLLRWDPSEHRIESLGVPVEQQGIPSLAGFETADLLYGEALHPEDQGETFFVYDVNADRLTFSSTDTGHVGHRDVMVGTDGSAYFSAGDGRLMVFRPGSDGVESHEHRLPGAWMRASTEPSPDGTLYGVTRQPDRLFTMRPSGEIQDLGPAGGYVASIALDTERERLYYVPHAHGGAWQDDAPVIAVDTATGEKEILVELEQAAEEHLSLRLGGSYNTVYDPSSGRLYIGMNAGSLGEKDESFGEVVLLVIELR